MHSTTVTRADRAALENLWGPAGTWVADTWTRINESHFGGKLHYHGVIFGLTPHGHALAHTRLSGRVTLHPALLDPRGDAWEREYKLGSRFAEDVLLHETIHSLLFELGVENNKDDPHHNTYPWCSEIVRITPGLGLPPIQALPVNPRRVNGSVVRRPVDGHLSRSDIAHWPHSLRPAGFYNRKGRIHVPI